MHVHSDVAGMLGQPKAELPGKAKSHEAKTRSLRHSRQDVSESGMHVWGDPLRIFRGAIQPGLRGVA
eukprot:9085149-Pyramimonas_sp.AAC.1